METAAKEPRKATAQDPVPGQIMVVRKTTVGLHPPDPRIIVALRQDMARVILITIEQTPLLGIGAVANMCRQAIAVVNMSLTTGVCTA